MIQFDNLSNMDVFMALLSHYRANPKKWDIKYNSDHSPAVVEMWQNALDAARQFRDRHWPVSFHIGATLRLSYADAGEATSALDYAYFATLEDSDCARFFKYRPHELALWSRLSDNISGILILPAVIVMRTK
tara:strand:- start:756 stop:1151 length:396 start_codon:yes stop_codon:yes gene_type:complete